MKAWKKTPPELVAAFDRAGTFQDAIVVRLAENDRVALLKLKGAAPFEPMGRPMKEYVVVPASIIATPKTLGAWLERGHRYALALPAKSKPPTTAKTGKQATAKKTAASTGRLVSTKSTDGLQRHARQR